jgi:hypothetical protein
MSLRTVAILGAAGQAVCVLVAAFSESFAVTLVFQGLIAGKSSTWKFAVYQFIYWKG